MLHPFKMSPVTIVRVPEGVKVETFATNDSQPSLFIPDDWRVESRVGPPFRLTLTVVRGERTGGVVVNDPGKGTPPRIEYY